MPQPVCSSTYSVKQGAEEMSGSEEYYAKRER